MLQITKKILQKNILKNSCINHSKIIWKQSYNYFSPIDKPILSLALTSFHQMSAQLMLYSFIDSAGAISPQMSIVWGAFLFRLGVEGFCQIIRSFKFNNKNDLKVRDFVSQRYEENDRSIVKWMDKVFILDSVRDLQFYGVIKDDINKTIWMYYRPSVIISSMANIYLCLNFLRGANYLISNPQYQQFCSSTIYLANLSLYDPKFITPVLIILINFYILKKSRHPLLININHPQNILHCINIAFMSGLLFVPIPGIYHFAYMGLSIGHLFIRSLKYWNQDLRRNIKKLIK